MQICLVAFAVVLNYIGSTIALTLRLPIYLDTIGTILTAALLGPVFGMIPGMLSGVFCFFTTDVISLYYTPVQLVIGFTAGMAFRSGMMRRMKVMFGTLLVTVPGTLVSSLITALVFGGFTSSGSSILVQIFHQLGLPMTASVFFVQIVTDYLDRFIAVSVVLAMLAVMTPSMKQKLAVSRE